MSTVQPIAGNQNYTRVENLAGQLENASLGDAQVAGNVAVGGSVSAADVIAAQLISLPSGKDLQKVELQTNGVAWHAAGAGNGLVVKGSTTYFTFAKASTVVALEVKATQAFKGTTGSTLNAGVDTAASGVGSQLLNAADSLTLLNMVDDTVSVSSGPGPLLGSAAVSPGVAAAAGSFVTLSAVAQALSTGQANVTVYYYEN